VAGCVKGCADCLKLKRKGIEPESKPEPKFFD
jgi:hypothetical protein